MTHKTIAALGGTSRSAIGIALLLAAPAVHAQTAPVATTPQGAPAPGQIPVQATSDQPTQPAPAQADEASGPDIVVTGIRASLANALSAKRNSAQVLDAISAEDIGKFPDKNVGEALQRVTGVQITRAGGEGSGVSIRGADPALNRVEINGQTALSTGAGVATRQVEFRDIPAEFVSRLEVVKSATADMTEGGLGGTVRIITRRPFDAKEGFLSGSAQAVYGDLADRVDPKFALIGSKLFANDTIGVLLSGTYEKRSLWYDQARTTGWRQIERFPTTPNSAANPNCLTGRNQARCVDIDNNGFGDFFPDVPRYVINREKTQRYALNGIVEWRPNDDLRAFVEGTYTRGKQTIDSQFLQLGTGQTAGFLTNNGGVDLTRTTLGQDQTVDKVTFTGPTGSAAGLSASYRNILGVIDRQQFNGQIGADWDVTDQFKVTGRASYAKAKAYNNEINATATAQGLREITIDYSGDQQAPNIILPIDPTTTQGLTQFIVLRRPRYNNQREIDFKLDGEYRPETWLTSLKVGVQKRDVKVTSELFDGTKTYNGYVAGTPGLGNITTNTYASGSSQTVVQSTGTNQAIIDQIRDIVGPNATLGDHDFFSTGDLGFNGIKRWLNLGMNVANAAGIPDPFVNPVAADTWGVTDKNLAAYVSAAFELEPFGKRLTGVAGARVINTKTNTRGSVVIAPVPAQNRPGSVTPFASQGEYTEFLPSLNLKLELIPNKLQLRATATEVIARPSPADLAPRFTLDILGLVGSRGNPNLQPYRAAQYDIGVEWYLSRVNFVSATLFRKDISSFVDRTTQQEVIDGVNYTISLPVNGTSKVQINGLELGGQYAFDFLPAPFDALGVTANYTWSDDKGYNQRDYFTGNALTFPGLSKHSYNLSGYFDNGTLSARISYNWRSRFLIAALDRGNNPAVGEPFGQWDASTSATLTDKVSVFIEGVNIFNAQRTENAASIYRRNIIETYGRRVYGGVRVKF